MSRKMLARVKLWRAKRKVRHEYGPVVADRFSDQQIMDLAKYEGPKSPDLVTERDIQKNRWEAVSEAEVNEIASNIVLAEQLKRAEHSGRVTWGDVGPPPDTADGRDVAYNLPRRKAVTWTEEYWHALEENQRRMEAVLRAALPGQHLAISWVKPEHMELTKDPYAEDQLRLGFAAPECIGAFCINPEYCQQAGECCPHVSP